MIDPSLLSVASEDRDDRPGSQYASKKDVKWALIAVAVAAIILYPAYAYMKGISNVHVCAANIKEMGQALSQYAGDNDDRFPPTHQEAYAPTGAPAVLNGRVSTWVTQAFRYNPKIEGYSCPTADDSESVPNEGRRENPETKRDETITVPSTYGMYRGLSAALQSGVESQTILLAETSNFGSKNSYDPVPYRDANGHPVPFDGFSVGWDYRLIGQAPGDMSALLRIPNIEPLLLRPAQENKDGTANTKSTQVRSVYPTRLAFRDSQNGYDAKGVYGRHQYIHAITVDGRLVRLNRADAHFRIEDSGRIGHPFRVPANLGIYDLLAARTQPEPLSSEEEGAFIRNRP